MKSSHNTGPPNKTLVTSEIKMIDGLSKLLDNRFRIPGTSIRFGLDPIIGLVPGIGDIVSYAMGSALILSMARHGATVGLVLKMLWNLTLDALIGLFPILGDVFDVWYKANRRNYLLYHRFLEKNKKGQPLWMVLLVVFSGLIFVFFILCYLLFFWVPELVFNFAGRR